MKVKSIALLMLIFMILVYAQTDNKSFNLIEIITGNREIVQQQRTVKPYSKISSNGFVDIILTDGKVGELTLKGDSNLMDLVETISENGELIIRIKKGISFKNVRNFTIYVPVDNALSQISKSGSGDISTAKDLNVSQLLIQSSGSGDIVLKNMNTNNFTIKLAGSGDFSSNQLKTDKINIKTSGSGDIKTSINSFDTNISMSGSGDMAVKGKTNKVKLLVAGSGDVNAVDFIADDVDVSVSGSADVKVNAQKTISATVAGSGEIRYTGPATPISMHTAGSGKIKKF